MPSQRRDGGEAAEQYRQATEPRGIAAGDGAGASTVISITTCRCGEIMIGPPGLPKFGRRVFSFATSREHRRERRQAWKWLAGLYLAGVLAHFSHHMTFGLPPPSTKP